MSLMSLWMNFFHFISSATTKLLLLGFGICFEFVSLYLRIYPNTSGPSTYLIFFDGLIMGVCLFLFLFALNDAIKLLRPFNLMTSIELLLTGYQLVVAILDFIAIFQPISDGSKECFASAFNVSVAIALGFCYCRNPQLSANEKLLTLSTKFLGDAFIVFDRLVNHADDVRVIKFYCEFIMPYLQVISSDIYLSRDIVEIGADSFISTKLKNIVLCYVYEFEYRKLAHLSLKAGFEEADDLIHKEALKTLCAKMVQFAVLSADDRLVLKGELVFFQGLLPFYGAIYSSLYAQVIYMS